MKRCPKCHAEVDDNFDTCWNCQYYFVNNEEDSRPTVCPHCNQEFATYLDYLSHEEACDENKNRPLKCPRCSRQFVTNSAYLTHKEECEGKMEAYESNGFSQRNKLQCLRCNIPLQHRGLFKFHEGTRMGVLGDLFELMENREEFEIYTCPKCGKVEFFMPLED